MTGRAGPVPATPVPYYSGTPRLSARVTVARVTGHGYPAGRHRPRPPVTVTRSPGGSPCRLSEPSRVRTSEAQVRNLIIIININIKALVPESALG
eukprot:747541-Hanusia_phi.AAC.1